MSDDLAQAREPVRKRPPPVVPCPYRGAGFEPAALACPHVAAIRTGEGACPTIAALTWDGSAGALACTALMPWRAALYSSRFIFWFLAFARLALGARLKVAEAR